MNTRSDTDVGSGYPVHFIYNFFPYHSSKYFYISAVYFLRLLFASFIQKLLYVEYRNTVNLAKYPTKVVLKISITTYTTNANSMT